MLSMRDILIVLAFVVLAILVAPRLLNRHLAQGDEMSAIANPVYAEARMKVDAGGNSIEGVMMAQTIDQADCQRQVSELSQELSKVASVCPTCKLQAPECKVDIAPQYTRLFDNKPTSLTYLSLARGQSSEREMRLIYWGVSVEQSDKLCNAVPDFQKHRKGAVSCVRATRG
jgi:hypothetical protein